VSAAYLVLNAGSSSVKFALFDAQDIEAGARIRGKIEAVDSATRLHVINDAGRALADERGRAPFTHSSALAQLLEWITRETGGYELAGAGHRVVHGGDAFVAPTLISPAVLNALASLNPMAPSHQPHNLAAIEAVSRLHPHLPQVACFDTAFHARQPPVATAFALPRAITEAGVRRYGFHGLSYDYIAGALPAHLGERANGRVVVAHLGHGASMCAMRDRKSIATTMGFSALDGLVMGARCGALDPGVILYLLDERQMNSAAIGRMLYEQSGLLGVSGESDDMRTLLASGSAHAREAVELFVYRIARELGSLAAALDGLDALVFTAGIGEGSPEIRARVCQSVAWLGAELDTAANASGGPLISTSQSKVAVLALATNEEIVIARACRALLAGKQKTS
jgi:acetate kinase